MTNTIIQFSREAPENSWPQKRFFLGNASMLSKSLVYQALADPRDDKRRLSHHPRKWSMWQWVWRDITWLTKIRLNFCKTPLANITVKALCLHSCEEEPQSPYSGKTCNQVHFEQGAKADFSLEIHTSTEAPQDLEKGPGYFRQDSSYPACCGGCSTDGLSPSRNECIIPSPVGGVQDKTITRPGPRAIFIVLPASSKCANRAPHYHWASAGGSHLAYGIALPMHSWGLAAELTGREACPPDITPWWVSEGNSTKGPEGRWFSSL